MSDIKSEYNACMFRELCRANLERIAELEREKEEAVALLRDCADRMARARRIIRDHDGGEWAMLWPREAREFLARLDHD